MTTTTTTTTETQWWINTKEEIVSLYPTMNELRRKAHELAGEQLVSQLHTMAALVDYIFLHATNIFPTVLNDLHESRIDDLAPRSKKPNNESPIAASDKAPIPVPSLFDKTVSPPTDDIVDVLKHMNEVYNCEVLTADQINIISEAGYTVMELISALDTFAGQQGLLALIDLNVKDIIKVHRIGNYFKTVYEKKQLPLTRLPLDAIKALYQDTFNSFLCVVDQNSGHIALYNAVKKVWQRIEYIEVRKLKGKDKITIGAVRDDSVNVLDKLRFGMRLFPSDAANDDEKAHVRDDAMKRADMDVDTTGSAGESAKKEKKKKKKKKKKRKKHKKKRKKKKKGGGSGGNRHPVWSLNLKKPTEVAMDYINGFEVTELVGDKYVAVRKTVEDLICWIDHNNIDVEQWSLKRGGALEYSKFTQLIKDHQQ